MIIRTVRWTAHAVRVWSGSSCEWLAAYRAALSDNDRYRVTSEGWGVDLVFEIADIPTETTVERFLEELSGNLRENSQSLPEERAEHNSPMHRQISKIKWQTTMAATTNGSYRR